MAACGAHAASSTFPDASASSHGDSDVPDGPFPCGTQPGLTCEPTQYCVLGCSGAGPIGCAPVLESGTCPVGMRFSPVPACDDDAELCSNAGEGYPTVCFDSLDAAVCQVTGPTEPPRTYECLCGL
jgi:hypothetical protein